jgi:hypothetical protein
MRSPIHGFLIQLPRPKATLALLSAVMLSACMAKSGSGSSAAPLSSNPASSVVAVSSSEVVSSSLAAPSSLPVSSSSSVISSVPASASSLPAPSSVAVSSSALVSSSSLVASSSVASSQSSVDLGPPQVSCELKATTNNGNDFAVESFRILNNDTRKVLSWKITLDFMQGNLNGFDSKVYGDAAKQMAIGTVTREGNNLVLIIEGGAIDPMTTQNIYGFRINSAGINRVPECKLKPKVEGYDGAGGGFVNVPQAQLDAYFANYPCGIGYTALGNGGWPACFRSDDGKAICKSGTSLYELKWTNNRMPITNTRQVTGFGSDLALVVTEDGAAYKAKIDIGVDPVRDRIVESGAVTASGGFTPRGCVMLNAGTKRDLTCSNDGQIWARPALPEDFDVVQLSASYKMNCALNRKGEVWCWGHPDALKSVITDTPARLPFNEPMVQISADQTTVCGVSYSGKSKCLLDKFVPGYAKLGEPLDDFPNVYQLATDFEPNAAFFHGAYNRGVVVRKDGTGAYYTQATANSGTPSILTLPNEIIAAGGKRDQISVLTSAGQVYGVNGGTSSLVSGYTAQAATCPLQ